MEKNVKKVKLQFLASGKCTVGIPTVFPNTYYNTQKRCKPSLLAEFLCFLQLHDCGLQAAINAMESWSWNP